MKGILPVILSVVLLASSCDRPMTNESFVKLGARDDAGLYQFELDMTDSLVCYDLWFYSRIDCGKNRMSSLRDFPMEITLVSPDNQKYRERVYFQIHEVLENSDYYSNQYRQAYRLGLVPVTHGVWNMSVRIDADEHIPGFRGIGLICDKKELN